MLSISIYSSAQEITQSLRGQVSDLISLKGIPLANLILDNGDESFITITKGLCNFRIDIGLYFKKNKKNYSRSVILGMQNIINGKNIAYKYYDLESNNVRTKYQLGFIPSLNYRIQF